MRGSVVHNTHYGLFSLYMLLCWEGYGATSHVVLIRVGEILYLDSRRHSDFMDYVDRLHLLIFFL